MAILHSKLSNFQRVIPVNIPILLVKFLFIHFITINLCITTKSTQNPKAVPMIILLKSSFSYGFSYGFHHFPMVFLYGFSMVFPAAWSQPPSAWYSPSGDTCATAPKAVPSLAPARASRPSRFRRKVYLGARAGGLGISFVGGALPVMLVRL